MPPIYAQGSAGSPLALVCTGFHRSGTSLTAQWLHRCGLPMGSDLLPPHPSNPEGHYEDIAAIDIGDQWLRRLGSQWLVGEDVPLPADAMLHEALAQYTASRDQDAKDVGAWCVKDPRISLALPAWSEALGPRGRFLLVGRHWAECAQSLFTRHSRELAHRLPSPEAVHAHLVFWRDPTIAYRSWLAYSQRLVVFAAMHVDTAAVITARGVAQSRDFPEFLRSRLGLAVPRPDALPVLKPELLTPSVNAAVVPPPPFWLRKALDATWQDLLSLADLRVPDEEVNWIEKRMPAEKRRAIESRVEAHCPDHPQEQRLIAPEAHSGNVAATLVALAAAPSSVRARRALAASRRSHANRRWNDSAELLDWAIANGKPSAPVLSLRGDISLALGETEQALGHFQAALQLQESDAYRLKCARCLRLLGQWQASSDLLDPLIQRSPGNAEAWIARSLAEEQLSDARTAADTLARFPGDDPSVSMTRAQLYMRTDFETGARLYRQSVVARLQSADLAAWLATTCPGLHSLQSWESLLESLCAHWRASLGEEAVDRMLGVTNSPD